MCPVQVRMNAEDPFRSFAPCSGILGEVAWPPGARALALLSQGFTVACDCQSVRNRLTGISKGLHAVKPLST